MQSVQLFECVKAGYFLITKVLGEHRRDEVIGEGEGRGVWEHSPSGSIGILILWNAISGVLRGQCLNKIDCHLMLIFICMHALRTSTRILFYIKYGFLSFLDISFS